MNALRLALLPLPSIGAFSLGLCLIPASVEAQGNSPSIQTLSNQVAQISSNDQRQDIRLYQLEKEVDRVAGAQSPPASVETGASKAPALVPYTPYTVRKGDSLWRIAMNHRVSPGDIMSFNRMPNETVVEGQVLMIPSKGGDSAMPSGAPAAFHTVKANETFHSISRKYGVSVTALTKANPKVNPNKLQTGVKLAIPAGAKVPAAPQAPKEVAYDYGLPAPEKKSSSSSYTVVTGDSLGAIAKKHGITTASLQAANGLKDPNSLKVGQKLTIPSGGKKTVASNTRPNPVPPPSKAPVMPKEPTPPKPPAGGQALTEPVPPVAPQAPAQPQPPTQSTVSPNRGVVAYRMEKGDTIDSVAQMFGTSGSEVRRLNKMSPSASIREGDEILVPGSGPVGMN